MAALAVFGAVLIVVDSSTLTSERIHEFVLSKVSIFVVALVTQACLAWILLPSAIRLLRPLGNPAISAECRKWGTAIAVITAASGFALEYLVGEMEAFAVLDNRWQREAVAVVNTLIINLPQVLLYIALSLLALRRLEENVIRIEETEMS